LRRRELSADIDTAEIDTMRLEGTMAGSVAVEVGGFRVGEIAPK
jgi:hypothetical protein